MLMELDITVVLVPLLPHQALSMYLHTYYCNIFKEYTPLGVTYTATPLQSMACAPENITEQLPGLVKHSPLKYFTVLTLSSSVASSSHTNTVLGCCWKADTVHMWLTPSSMALYRAKALWAPVIRIITCTPRHREGQSGRAQPHPAKLRMGAPLSPSPQPLLCAAAAALAASALNEITACWVTAVVLWAPVH